jgi:uncharacterized protein YabE (DUF348 family)
MKNRKILIPVAAGILIALVLLAVFGVFPTQKNVTILVEEQPIELTTTARTVGEALESLGFPPKPEDEITPAVDTRLRDGDTISYTPAFQVSLTADGQEYLITTTQRVPAIWLAQAGLTLAPEDQLVIYGQNHSPDQPVTFQPHISAEVRRAVTITLQRGANQWTILSAAATLGQALWEAGFNISISDLLTPAPETPLAGPVTARLVPGRQISVQADGKTLKATTSAQTVGTALAQVGLSLQGLDYSLPAADQPIPEDGNIQIVRVREEVVINQETIPFTTLFEPLDDEELDVYKVTQIGQVGLKAQRVRITFEDGAETSREVEDEWVLRDPRPRIEGYGTKIVVRTENTPDGPIEYWRKVTMWATSYSPCGAGQDRCYPGTSLGLPVQKGVVAVIYDWFIPMGNHTVYVPGYGHAIIADVGGGVPGRHWIDLGYTDEDYVPWAQWVTVYFTTPIPPAHEILYILPYK